MPIALWGRSSFGYAGAPRTKDLFTQPRPVPHSSGLLARMGGYYNDSVTEAASKPRPSTHAAPRFTRRQRFLLPIIAWVGSAVIRLLCCTLRYELSFETTDPEDCYLRPAIWAFWHSCLVLAAYRFRNRDIAVLTSQSFDGECISRILEKL